MPYISLILPAVLITGIILLATFGVLSILTVGRKRHSSSRGQMTNEDADRIMRRALNAGVAAAIARRRRVVVFIGAALALAALAVLDVVLANVATGTHIPDWTVSVIEVAVTAIVLLTLLYAFAYPVLLLCIYDLRVASLTKSELTAAQDREEARLRKEISERDRRSSHPNQD